jgi:hypothetical protein
MQTNCRAHPYGVILDTQTRKYGNFTCSLFNTEETENKVLRMTFGLLGAYFREFRQTEPTAYKAKTSSCHKPTSSSTMKE